MKKDNEVSEIYADNFYIEYEFLTNNTFKKNEEILGKWIISNDSLLELNTNNIKQKYNLKFETNSIIKLIERKDSIIYTYQFIRSK